MARDWEGADWVTRAVMDGSAFNGDNDAAYAAFFGDADELDDLEDDEFEDD